MEDKSQHFVSEEQSILNLIKGGEKANVEYKQESNCKACLIEDFLALCNNEYEKSYFCFGVDDKKKIAKGITEDDCKSIIDTIKGNLNSIPRLNPLKIYCTEALTLTTKEANNSKLVLVIVIESKLEAPYFYEKDGQIRHKCRKIGFVQKMKFFSRTGDNNHANYNQLERLFKKRLGVSLSPLERLESILDRDNFLDSFERIKLTNDEIKNNAISSLTLTDGWGDFEFVFYCHNQKPEPTALYSLKNDVEINATDYYDTFDKKPIVEKRTTVKILFANFLFKKRPFDLPSMIIGNFIKISDCDYNDYYVIVPSGRTTEQKLRDDVSNIIINLRIPLPGFFNLENKNKLQMQMFEIFKKGINCEPDKNFFTFEDLIDDKNPSRKTVFLLDAVIHYFKERRKLVFLNSRQEKRFFLKIKNEIEKGNTNLNQTIFEFIDKHYKAMLKLLVLRYIKANNESIASKKYKILIK